jgi:hypothetical protein
MCLIIKVESIASHRHEYGIQHDPPSMGIPHLNAERSGRNAFSKVLVDEVRTLGVLDR